MTRFRRKSISTAKMADAISEAALVQQIFYEYSDNEEFEGFVLEDIYSDIALKGTFIHENTSSCESGDENEDEPVPNINNNNTT